MGHFGTQDQCFQLPVNVGFDCRLEGLSEQKSLGYKMIPDMPSDVSSSEKHDFVLTQFIGELLVSVIMVT